MIKDKQNKSDASKKKITLKQSLPFIILFVLLFSLLISTSLSRRSPEIESISPKIGKPGDNMVIKGRFFGSKRNGARVEVGSSSPSSSAYKWEKNRISFIITEEMKGGLVKVITKHGNSKQIFLFTNKKHLPVLISGPIDPQKPYIVDSKPVQGSVGTSITITGRNFGAIRGNSNLYFTWIPGDRKMNIIPSGYSNSIPARAYDQDYISWSDEELMVRVPDGASSGNIWVVTDKDVSNKIYFEVMDSIGSKLFKDERIYHIQYYVSIRDVNAKHGNGLYLWMPRILDTPEQRDIKPIIQEPEPIDNYHEELLLYFLKDLKTGQEYKVLQSYMFSRYEIKTRVNTARVKLFYNKTSKLYHKYTTSDDIVPSKHKKIVSLSRSIIGNERSPYKKAWKIYNYVINRLSYKSKPNKRDVLAAIKTRKGDAYLYSILFCALTRSAGIPSRPVAGYIVSSEGYVVRHYWNEFFLEDMGWIPVDAFLGDGKKYDDFPREINAKNYYFGNMDNHHITFTRGLITLSKMNPKGNVVKREDALGLQTFHEEYIGRLHSYNSSWSELELLGVY